MSEVKAVNSFQTQWTIEDLKAKAEDLAGDQLNWFTHPSGAEVGIDWANNQLFILDPDSPDFPQIEGAEFIGIDQWFKPEEAK